jgi:hypothetical protein
MCRGIQFDISFIIVECAFVVSTLAKSVSNPFLTFLSLTELKNG